jgi:TfoX/Sxy family transcriptional regulator of competence genes
MAYDEQLADRIRGILGERKDVSERKMFGGVAFLIAGHMCVGIVGKDLMVRVGKEAFEKAVGAPHARPMDFTGKPSTGSVYIAPAGVKATPALRKWVEEGVKLISSLPAKASTGSTQTRPSKLKRVRPGRKTWNRDQS